MSIRLTPAAGRAHRHVATLLLTTALCGALPLSSARADETAPTDTPEVEVLANRAGAPVARRFDLPQTQAGVNAETIADTLNMMDSGDALKYLPSLFLRKRNEGDVQAVLATRTWGVNSSARTLVYADDLLISALIGNNNTNSAPRWGLVAPEEIERVDMLYGPYAAAYPGNSMGGVVQITTRQPERFTASAQQQEAFQNVDLYKTHRTLQSSQTSATVGDKMGRLSWFLSANYLNSDSQPLTFVTTTGTPAGTSGTILARNKLGATANVVGAGGLLNSQMTNAKLKLVYDLLPDVKLGYTVAYWNNDSRADTQSYLTTATGQATFGGVAGFANGHYSLSEGHLANAVSLKTDTKGTWDGELVVSDYRYLSDIQRAPNGVTATGLGYTSAGKIARLDGTGWSTADLKGIWRPGGLDGAHEVTAGLHADEYRLNNPTYNTTVWSGGSDKGQSLASDGRGKTQTLGLWLQDAWKVLPDWTLTTGLRAEDWRAIDGYNYAGGTSTGLLGEGATGGGAAVTGNGTAKHQPNAAAAAVSPKVTLDWRAVDPLTISASLGEATRFPTVSELYQLVQTGTTYSAPNANLKPETELSEELAFKYALNGGWARLSFFQEHVNNAMIAQTAFLTGSTPVSYTVNVNRVRNRGVELALDKDDVLIEGLEAFGSVTYVDSTILSDPSFASTTGTTATGKQAPYVPKWRATWGATYRPDAHWALTAAARYSGRQFSTLDNTDSVSHVFGAFDRFLVADVHADYKLSDHVTLNAGIDNINDEKYYLYHPFPGRTFFAGVKAQI